MNENWSAILNIATKALTVKVPGQTEPSRYALDRALRVVRCIERLAPVVGERLDRIDLTTTAALYACLAQSNALSPGENGGARGGGKQAEDEAYGDAAELAADQLKDLLSSADVDAMIVVMQEQRRRDAKAPEARVLADSLAMEEFGLVGMWNQSRNFHASGKTLEQLVKMWKAQHDYGYWETRLRDGFHYEASRRTARERLGQMRGIYERLQREHLCEDVGGNPLGHY